MQDEQTKVLWRWGVLGIMAVLLVVGWIWRAGDAQRADDARQAILETFDSYKNATLARDAKTATGLLSRQSLEFFEEVRLLALHSGKSQLDSLDPVRRQHVMFLRNAAQRFHLDVAGMSSRDVAAIDYMQGLLGSELRDTHELSTVIVDGQRAYARLRSGEKVWKRGQYFERDGDDWRIDIVPVLAQWNAGNEERAVQMGISTVILSDLILEALSPTTRVDQLYEPLGQPGLTMNEARSVETQ